MFKQNIFSQYVIFFKKMPKLKKQILLKSVRTVSFHQCAKISHEFHCIQLSNLQQGVKMPGEIWCAFFFILFQQLPRP